MTSERGRMAWEAQCELPYQKLLGFLSSFVVTWEMCFQEFHWKHVSHVLRGLREQLFLHFFVGKKKLFVSNINR